MAFLCKQNKNYASESIIEWQICLDQQGNAVDSIHISKARLKSFGVISIPQYLNPTVHDDIQSRISPTNLQKVVLLFTDGILIWCQSEQDVLYQRQVTGYLSKNASNSKQWHSSL